MALSMPIRWKSTFFVTLFLDPYVKANGFRSDTALEAIAKARGEENVQTLVLYSCPSFSALFAKLFHSHFDRPCLILPFSSIHPFRIQDLCFEGLGRCYLFYFVGPPGFATLLSKQTMCKVTGFDHRISALSRISSTNKCQDNVTFHVDTKKSSSIAAYDAMFNKIGELNISCQLVI